MKGVSSEALLSAGSRSTVTVVNANSSPVGLSSKRGERGAPAAKTGPSPKRGERGAAGWESSLITLPSRVSRRDSSRASRSHPIIAGASYRPQRLAAPRDRDRSGNPAQHCAVHAGVKNPQDQVNVQSHRSEE